MVTLADPVDSPRKYRVRVWACSVAVALPAFSVAPVVVRTLA